MSWFIYDQIQNTSPQKEVTPSNFFFFPFSSLDTQEGNNKFFLFYLITKERTEATDLIFCYRGVISLSCTSTNAAGPLPPSRRRSLFTLATSMFLFSSKAFNILPIAYCAKVALTERTVWNLSVMKSSSLAFPCQLFLEYVLKFLYFLCKIFILFFQVCLV